MERNRQKLATDKYKCTGCLVCEIACSSRNAGIMQPKASAIRIIHADRSADGENEPVVCRQCERMVCLHGENEGSGAEEAAKFYWSNLDRAERCPFGAVFVYQGRVVHCHLCGGEPECVKVCPTGAIVLESP